MASKVNPKLEAAIERLLDKLDDVGTDEKPKYSLTNQMAIIDRALKLEALKAKMEGSDWGGAFDEETETAEDDAPEADDLSAADEEADDDDE